MSDLKDNVERTQPTAAPVRMIDIGDIHVGKRLRALNQGKVTELADSMARQGQLQPIVVRKADHHTDTVSSKYILLAGLHRLQAALTSLGWTKIQATVLDYGDCADIDAAALAEIDENLCRAELSPAERAAHIGRRKEIYERLNPETKHGAAPGAGKGKGKRSKDANLASFQKATAKATRQSKRKIARDAKRAKDLGKFLDRINGTCLDTGVEMDALIKLSETEQEDLVARAAAGEVVSAKTVLVAKKSTTPPGAPVAGSVERPIEASALADKPVEATPADGGSSSGAGDDGQGDGKPSEPEAEEAPSVVEPPPGEPTESAPGPGADGSSPSAPIDPMEAAWHAAAKIADGGGDLLADMEARRERLTALFKQHCQWAWAAGLGAPSATQVLIEAFHIDKKILIVCLQDEVDEAEEEDRKQERKAKRKSNKEKRETLKTDTEAQS